MTDPKDTVTFTVRRSHLWFGSGLLVGLAVGFLLGGWLRGAGASPRQLARAADGAAVPESAPSAPGAEVVDVAYEGRPYRGPADASIVLVEFTDYQCPFCGRFFRETYPSLLQEYGDRIRFVVRNYPLGDRHPHAPKAAEAAECAFDQGKFWEYHDLLLRRQNALDVASLKRYAEEVDLDARRFSTCLDSGEKADVVAEDLRDGAAYGVTGTPTFFLNGRKIVGAQPMGVFRARIEQLEADEE